MAKLVKLQTDFAETPNHLAQDRRLSMKARGLWTYMQSLPNDWDFSIERIAKSCDKEGYDAIRTGIAELEQFGYLNRKKVMTDKGGWDMDYYLLDGRPAPENPDQDKPDQDNPMNIKETSNKEIETKKLQGASRPVVAKKKLECWEEKEQIPGWDTLNSIYQGAFIVWYGLGWKFPKRDDLEDYKKRIKTSLIKSGLADTTSQGTVAPHATLIEVELMRFRDHWRDKKIQLPLKAWETWTNNMASFREKRR
jgi:hypothetical protein